MDDVHRLIPMLERARRLGFLGPGPIEDHLTHARAYARHASVARAALGLDLGSGGGIPGLVLACVVPASRWVLLDAHRARTAFLAEAVQRVGLAGRVEVVTARAEALGHDRAHRGRYDVVVARAFGRPAVVAECAAPLLRVGGGLVVSEPPEGGDRWSSSGMARLGLELDRVDTGPPRMALMVQCSPCPDRYPRRVGVPGKRPLW